MNIWPLGIFDYSLVLVTLQTHYGTAVTGGHCQYCYITEAYANMLFYAKNNLKNITLHFKIYLQFSYNESFFTPSSSN